MVPLGHLDLKPDHLRSRAGGEVVILDIETVRPDVTGLIDLVTIPAVLRQAGHEPEPDQVLELYVDATRPTAGGGPCSRCAALCARMPQGPGWPACTA
ncbi:hypothetical protein N4G70_34495 [Streptomyces sp. ASQP_92]|uniref:hypothetical protein n=1 Tax=Streptomyces sp. ASQP_92 TaxID=2979116 RepID=UPI0021BFA0FB|nr:hypothetical protein [Streptomyces sp. ASQP_92]MCT9093930.1 hypothetical protein [Streptomyces sp. ASQP_92]